jgi:hypothetical protein
MKGHLIIALLTLRVQTEEKKLWTPKAEPLPSPKRWHLKACRICKGEIKNISAVINNNNNNNNNNTATLTIQIFLDIKRR